MGENFSFWVQLNMIIDDLGNAALIKVISEGWEQTPQPVFEHLSVDSLTEGNAVTKSDVLIQ
jgi:hypothetical protein